MSSATDIKLPASVEKMLADMPVADRDWEALALRVTEQAMLAKDTPAALLEPPLPPEEGEDGFERKESAKVVATAPVSLAELARASVKKKNESAKDIALESLAVASQARAQADEIAERVQAATQKARTSTPDVEEAKPAPVRPAAAVAAAAERAATTTPPAATPAQARVSRGPWIVSGVAVLAAAAAIAIAMRPNSGPPPLAVSPAAEAPAAKVASPSPAEPAAPAASPIPEAEQPRSVEGIALAPAPAGRAAPAAPMKGGAAAPAPSAAPGVAPEAIVLEDEEPAAAPAPAPPAPAPSPKMVPAELPRGGLPDKPSAGAAYAAIGPYMGSARACVAGHDDPSTARIVFSSDGTVQSVSVSGPAAGTAAAGCIESAFKKARVQPFAAPTFSMSTVVRPQ